jgi:hypothetical protein
MHALAFCFVILGIVLVLTLVIIGFSGKKAATPISGPKNPSPAPNFSACASPEPEPLQEEEPECRCSAPGGACCAK